MFSWQRNQTGLSASAIEMGSAWLFPPAHILGCFLCHSIPQMLADSAFKLRVQRWCRCGPGEKVHMNMNIMASWFSTLSISFSAFWVAPLFRVHCLPELQPGCCHGSQWVAVPAVWPAPARRLQREALRENQKIDGPL